MAHSPCNYTRLGITVANASKILNFVCCIKNRSDNVPKNFNFLFRYLFFMKIWKKCKLNNRDFLFRVHLSWFELITNLSRFEELLRVVNNTLELSAHHTSWNWHVWRDWLKSHGFCRILTAVHLCFGEIPSNLVKFTNFNSWDFRVFLVYCLQVVVTPQIWRDWWSTQINSNEHWTRKL